MGQALSDENPNEDENVPQTMLGTRVVRGPDWKWDEQDGGDGHMGTVRKYKNSEEVIIVWDKGTVANYRCNDSYDLRILDSGSAGVKHETVTCDSCRKTPIFGTRWTCSECDDYDLCSECYHGDKHVLQHRFYCIDLPERTKTLVAARENSTKIPAYGLFAGTRVTRGPDWQWGAQDGLVAGSPGEILEIRDWVESSPRTAAAVSWDLGANNLYRVGYKGKVDLKAVSEVTAFSFYRDHLPVLETYASYTKWSIGDRVRIDLDLETFQSLQENHGGWVDNMEEAIGRSGKIAAFRKDDVFVLYPDGKRWLLNPAVLTRLDSDSEDENNQNTTANESNSSNNSNLVTLEKPSFKVGDLVQISSDILMVKLLQLGHGEWVDAMIPTLGKIGKVRKILDDNNLRIFVGGRKWTYNAACVSHIDTIHENLSKCLSVLLTKMTKSEKSPGPTGELVKAAADNDLQKAEELLSEENLQINGLFSGYTPLQAACQNGAIDVVKLLIHRGIELEAEGTGGTRAIHLAAHGDSVSILQLLAQTGADLNARTNAGRSALHVAVNMNRTDSVRCLLELKALPSLQDGIGDTPLHDAIANEQMEIVQLLLDFKADISVTNTNGFNCLQYAAYKGKVDIIKALVATRPPPHVINEKKDDGFTALHLAVVNEYLEVVELLIHEGKADIHAQNSKLQSSLHLAVLEQNMELVQLLIKEGASLEMADKDGDTPLHEAVRYHCFLQLKQLHGLANLEKLLLDIIADDPTKKSTSIACFLVEQGADLTSKNNMNRTPLDLCIDPKLSEALAKSRMVRLGTDADKQISNNGSDAKSVECARAEEASVRDRVPLESKVKPISESHDAATSLQSKQAPNNANSRSFNASKQKGNVYENHNENHAGNDDFSQMKQQLDDMKQQILCPVCMDRSRNLAFMCGHTTCQFCGDRVKECPICRKPVEKRVLLF